MDVENRLGNLLDEKLPLCSASCNDFQTQAEQMSQKRKVSFGRIFNVNVDASTVKGYADAVYVSERNCIHFAPPPFS